MSATASTTPVHTVYPRGASLSSARARWRGLAVSALFWAMVVTYVVVVCALCLRRYDAFLMHALDMGNMEQAVWNTAHGHPFHFTNMRQRLIVEAFGTDTRLSFHVEPILLPISLLYLLYQHPPFLLALQTLVLASGALPLRQLARRHLPGSALAELGFPLAYLLFPALQAANLYEFHPVTLTAVLLLWALDFADQRRALLFILAALAAAACKEEIGFVVALLALWSLRRGMPRRVALPVASLAALWTLLAVLVIVPAAQRSQHSAVQTSPYLARFMDQSFTAPNSYRQVTATDVLRYWAGHPDRLAGVVLGTPKRGFLQRLFAPSAYLALLSPLTLAISLPSFLLILLTVDQHMYGGLGHYSAEFVGLVMAASVFGLARLVRWVGRRGLPRRPALAAGGCLLLLLSMANARVNGFTPLSAALEWPAITEHVRLGQRMLALIPPQAAVSAQDTLNPHLSDRAGIYLFPDTRDADYVALDVSASPIPTDPNGLKASVMGLLGSRRWDIQFADDGYLLLRRRPGSAAPAVPRLPAAFYRFALPAQPAIAHPLRVRAGDDLLLLGYTISWREVVNLRVPNVVLTTYWTPLHQVTRALTMTTYLTDVDGSLAWRFDQQSALAWLPTTGWRPGQVVAVSSTSMGLGATEAGVSSACVAVYRVPGSSPPAATPTDPRLPLAVTSASGSHRLRAGNKVLCVGQIPVVF